MLGHNNSSNNLNCRRENSNNLNNISFLSLNSSNGTINAHSNPHIHNPPHNYITSSINFSNSEINYSLTTTKNYWCHLCKKEFSKIFIENIDVQCKFCQNYFCEEISQYTNEQEHPSNFLPYEGENQSSNDTNNTSQNSRGNFITSNNPRSISRINGGNLSILESLSNRIRRPRTTSSLLDMIFSLLRERNTEEANMESIINTIMQNDTNRYGNPPASKEAVEKLEKIELNEENINIITKNSNCENCSVCKDNFLIYETLINLPCKHAFHDECLTPWLSERNSCPTCRYELPTDDIDYEARKNSL